ncbi:MAG: DUF1559 domain-containing protein [Candidatus Omnitrophica bacterium]|nr:DUF1559 domain-containing protein [Candidatus Omnitrophota bacterium]
MNNLKQIGLSVMLYAQDWGDWLPLGGLNAPGGFKDLIRLGYMDHKLFSCPADTTRKGNTVLYGNPGQGD